MAVDYQKIAEGVLANVGGKDNVASATHCMTRLRLTFKDKSKVNSDAIKGLTGVLGINWAGEQLQVIIGQAVPKVYDAVLAMGVAGGGSIDENLDENLTKEKLTPKVVGNKILDYLSGSMVQMIPLIMASGLFRTLAVVMGPQMFNLWAADSGIYTFFYTTLYEAGFYFLPIYLGYCAAKKVGANPLLGLLSGGILIAPSIITAATAGTTINVYGLDITAANYSQSVLPIILTIPVLAVVEKFMKKHVPEVLSTLFTPFFTMIVVVPIELIVLAPTATSSARASLLSSSALLISAASASSSLWQSSVPSGSSSLSPACTCLSSCLPRSRFSRLASTRSSSLLRTAL